MAGAPVESVDRALLVLQAVSAAGATGTGVSDLATALGLHKTTVHRALAALAYRGFVVQDAGSGRYRLGPSTTELAGARSDHDRLPVLLHPALVELCRETEELVHLGLLTGTSVVYIDKVEPERPIRVWSAIGRRSPAATTGLGRALLAHRGTGRAAVAAYLPAGHDGGEQAENDLWRVLEQTRERGYARDVEENERGVSCVAVPLLRDGVAAAAVSVTAPAERMTEERVAALLQTISAVLPPLLPEDLSLPR
jgi:IclR family transcriptional regulator, acetate operon repressor